MRDTQHLHGIDICTVVDVRRIAAKEHPVAKAEDDLLPARKRPAIDDHVAIRRADDLFTVGDGQRFQVRAADDRVLHKPYHLPKTIP
ncbi:hypothetical protein SDC9_195959 [bioreactor metagenome]|uniref:Uncharacterized protein n=1 Tax=bioreactor metagenome TaxID=1076179 RepID=A0A645IBZ2_9ZZZZ